MNKEKQDKIVVGVTIVILLSILLFLFLFNSKNTTASKEVVVQKKEIVKVDGVTKAHGYAITGIMIKEVKQDSAIKHHDSLLSIFMTHFNKYHK
jgi:hypothetical protein